MFYRIMSPSYKAGTSVNTPSFFDLLFPKQRTMNMPRILLFYTQVLVCFCITADADGTVFTEERGIYEQQ